MTSVPTLYEWAGGHDVLRRLTEVFYDRVERDEVLAPVFAHMSPDHRDHVAVGRPDRGERRRGPAARRPGVPVGVRRVRRVGHPARAGELSARRADRARGTRPEVGLG